MRWDTGGCGPPTLGIRSGRQPIHNAREGELILTLIAGFTFSHTLVVDVGTGTLLGVSVGTSWETDSEIGSCRIPPNGNEVGKLLGSPVES